jgi:hypothetical protein
LVERLLSWKNSGFSIHNQVKIKSWDHQGRESLAQYILRSPFSLEKMTYQQQSKTVLYRSKMNPVLKKNFAVFPVLDWIATLTTHIPNTYEGPGCRRHSRRAARTVALHVIDDAKLDRRDQLNSIRRLMTVDLIGYSCGHAGGNIADCSAPQRGGTI